LSVSGKARKKKRQRKFQGKWFENEKRNDNERQRYESNEIRIIPKMKKLTTRNIIFIMFFFIQITTINAQAVWNNISYVHRQNQQILDGQNNVIKLEGVNLGGWLLWEGWIFGGGLTSETEINANMESKIGTVATENFRDSLHKYFITREDIEAISQQCFNVVRIPINHTLLEDDSNQYFYKPEGWAILDSVLDWCEDYNVYAILDLHAAPGGQNNGFIADPDGLFSNLWSLQTNKYRTISLWKAIADRYHNRGIIAGYDLLNEPNTGVASDLISLYSEIIDSIRTVDTVHMIHLEGNNFAKDFSLFNSLPDSNVCFHFHFYTWLFSGSIPSHLYEFTELSDSMNVPIFCGEWGENDAMELDLTLSLLHDPYYKVSGNTFWTCKKMKKENQDPFYFGIDSTLNWNKSIQWISNTNLPEPTVAEMQTGIDEFIYNMRYQNCTVDTILLNLLKACIPLSIETYKNEEKYFIYPNPFTTTINIKNNGQNIFYKLINSNGQTVWTGKQINNQDFSWMTNGLYILIIYNNNSAYTKKLIKN